MATTSLGRLTLDLAVRLSEFVDGMTRAERETRDRTERMTESVNSFRDNLADALGGTEIGNAIDSLNSRLGSLSGGIGVAAGALAGMAIGGAVVATGAMARMAIETAQADKELYILANRANTSVRNFQVLGKVSEQLGVTQDQLGSILADVQEKLGEFSATEGGGAADFFEALQNNTSLTTEEIRELGRTVQGKDGVEAIQLMKDKMDELGATQQEQRFVFESLASDLGNLMPLFEDGGELLAKYGEELEVAGVIKSKEAIEQSQVLAAQTQALHLRYDGLKQQLATQMMPVLNNLLDHFLGGSEKGNQFGGVIKGVGYAAKATGTIIVGLAAGVSALVKAFSAVYDQFYNLGQTGRAFWEADGVLAKIDALNSGMSRAQTLASTSVSEILGTFSSAVNSVQGMWGDTLTETDGLSAALFDLNKAGMHAGAGLSVSTKQADEQAKAAEKAAKATQNQTKEISRMEQVYSAFIKAGMSDKQARIMTAEVGREGSFLDANLFGFHRDPENGAVNAGMISWQGSRGKELIKRLSQQGLFKGNRIVKSQESLDAMAVFVVDEIMNNPRFKQTRDQFLANPNIDYQKGAAITGRNYIAWRYDDPKYKNGHKHRDNYYNQLNSKLGNKGLANDLASQAREIDRQQQEILRKRESIAYKWADERKKLEIDLQNELAYIEEAYGKDTPKALEYKEKVIAEYEKKKNDRIQSIADKYLSASQLKERQEIRRHEKAIEQIKLEFVEDDPSRQLYLDLEAKKHQDELKQIQWANDAKLREQNKYMQSIRESMHSNMDTTLQSSIDRTMKSQLRPEEYEQWRLGEDEAQAYNSVSSQYRNRQAEINKTGELGEYVLPEEERFKLLEEAKLEHEQKLYAIEAEFGAKRLELDKQQAAMRTQIQSSAFSDMTSLASTFFGENSRMHRAAFALERAFAVQKAVMNIQETYSNTFNAISAIPIVGPYIAAPMAAAASAMQVARAANLKGMSAPSVAGIAHGGLDYVPETATYLLKEGEGVIQPKQNKALTNFLSKQDKNSGSNITIIESSQSRAEVSQDNGQVTVQMVDRMIKNSFKNLRNHNSFESKQIQRNTTARPRR